MTRTITVKGVGRVTARPDCIELMLSITGKNLDYEKAMEDAAGRIENLKAAAERAGFERSDLKTISFHVNTQYESVRDGGGGFRNVFTGYACAYRLKLTFDFDSSRLAAVLTAIAASGADPEIGVSFTVKDPARVSGELLASAAANAREKAEVLCRAAGAELGQLVSIDYSWDEVSIVSQTRCNMDACMPMMAAGKARMPEIEPDDIRLNDTATFVWELL